MTVTELIELLQTCDPEARVLAGQHGNLYPVTEVSDSSPDGEHYDEVVLR